MKDSKNCFYCNNEDVMTICKFCKEKVCIQHILPENHKCIGLDEYKHYKHPRVEKLKDTPLYIDDHRALKILRKKGKRSRKSIRTVSRDVLEHLMDERKKVEELGDQPSKVVVGGLMYPSSNSRSKIDPDSYNLNKNKLKIFLIVFAIISAILLYFAFSGGDNLDTATGKAILDDPVTTTVLSRIVTAPSIGVYDPPTTVTARIIPKGTSVDYVDVEQYGNMEVIRDSITLKREASYLELNDKDTPIEVEYFIESTDGIQVFFVTSNSALSGYSSRRGNTIYQYEDCQILTYKRELTGTCYMAKGGILIGSKNTNNNQINYTIRIKPTKQKISEVSSLTI